MGRSLAEGTIDLPEVSLRPSFDSTELMEYSPLCEVFDTRCSTR
jgi:hypothetical protein